MIQPDRRLIPIDAQPLFCHLPEIRKRILDISNVANFALEYAGISSSVRQAAPWPLFEDVETPASGLTELPPITDNNPGDDLDLSAKYSVLEQAILPVKPDGGFPKIEPVRDPARAKHFKDGTIQPRPVKEARPLVEGVIYLDDYRNRSQGQDHPPITA